MDDQERGEWVSYGHEVYARFVSRVQQLEQGKTRLQHQRGLEHADKAEGKRVSCMEKRRIYGSFPELADLYLNDKKKVVLDFSESKCLVPLLVPTEQSPNQYVGLRWSKVTSPTRLAQDRDYCYIEVMKPFVDARGRTAWAKCSHSVRYPGCPENPAMIRGQIFHSGIIFRETSQPGLLEATFYYDCDTRGIPSFLAPMVLKSRGKNNAELINHYLKMARMATSRHDNPLLQTSVSDLLAKEKRCGSCSNRLPRWRSKEKCHYCRAYVCEKCRSIVTKNYRIAKEDVSVCINCAEHHGQRLECLNDEDWDASSRASTSQHDDDILSSPSSCRSRPEECRLNRCNSVRSTASSTRSSATPKVLLTKQRLEDITSAQSATYSRANPCDLSYLQDLRL